MYRQGHTAVYVLRVNDNARCQVLTMSMAMAIMIRTGTMYTTHYLVHINMYLFIYLFITSKYIFSHPIYYLRTSMLSLLVVTQIRGHIEGRLFPPPPYYGSCLTFLSREDFSSSLVDSRRIVYNTYIHIHI